MLPEPPLGSFASDNSSGVHPAVMDALAEANSGHVRAYGSDPWTERAKNRFCELLGIDAAVLFTWGGTGANVVGLASVLQPWQAVICAQSSHMAVDECGAPERFTGSKLIDLPSIDGKLTPVLIEAQLHGLGDEHHVQPHVVSLTQSTEVGTVYSVDELKRVTRSAHDLGLIVHVDGARIANAAAHLGCGLGELVVETDVDVLTFGGTKNGLMYGEAVIFINPDLGRDARFVRKQAAQLPSKMRYIAAQFDALLTDDLWLTNARHANEMAERLARGAERLPGLKLVGEPESNAVFVRLPHDAIEPLIDWSPFWVWDESADLVRWMCSFDTTTEDVDRFLDGAEQIVARYHSGGA